MDNNVVSTHTLDQYDKKYRNRRNKLSRFTKKQVEEFDKKNPGKEKHSLLKNKKWWLIGDTYYQIPKTLSLTWFRNLSGAVQVGTCLLGAGVIATSVAVPLVLLNKKNPEPVIDTSSLVYRMKFLDENLGKNSSTKKINDANVIGLNKSTVGLHKDAGVLSFTDSDHGTNYFSLPTETLKNDTTTIAVWVKLPNDLLSFNSNAALFSMSFSDGGYFYTSPFDSSTGEDKSWNGYRIQSNFNGTSENLTAVKASTEVTGYYQTPLTGTIHPIAGSWQLMGFTFSSTNLNVYENNKLVLSYSGNYSLKDKNITDFTVGYSKENNARDFNAMISDFRIYNKELKEEDYIKEFNTTYKDYLTTNFDFSKPKANSNPDNFGISEYSRGLMGKTSSNRGDDWYETVDGKKGLSLRGIVSHDCLNLNGQLLMGHNEVTISTDIYFKGTSSKSEQCDYQRIFEFSAPDGQKFFSMYYTFKTKKMLQVRFCPNRIQEEDCKKIYNESFVPVDNRWTNVTLTASKEKGSIYVDGYLIATTSSFGYTPSLFCDFANCLATIGQSRGFPNDDSLGACVSNFKVYAKELSELEVKNSLGLEVTENDEEAVNKAMNNFKLETLGSSRVKLSKDKEDGVSYKFESINKTVIDDRGYLYPSDERQLAYIKVTFTRNNIVKEGVYNVIVEPRSTASEKVKNTSLSEVSYAKDSYYQSCTELNAEYMMSLNVDRLLHNYRKICDPSTKPIENSFAGWIATDSGGAGQFESQYVGALARLSQHMGDYKYQGGLDIPYKDLTVKERCIFMIQEIAKCQEIYAKTWPSAAGYLGAFTHQCFKRIEGGSNNFEWVRKGEVDPNLPNDVKIWVPFYMFHKNLMMCYDVYTYLDDVDTQQLALKMLEKACDWCYKEIKDLSEAEKANVLRIEYGGMSEVMYLVYNLSLSLKESNPEFYKKANNYLKVARFFEEDDLIDGTHEGRNVLPGLHSNTTIPKYLSCCAAYQATGDSYYLEVAQSGWDMIVNHMTYPNGGISRDEHFEEPDYISQDPLGMETCCSYNMLRLTDYLFKFTKNTKYPKYFENTFYNHIMSSIRSDGVYKEHLRDYDASAGKVYKTTTDFGHHKIYSTKEDAFWCCCCTGQETFSKLTYGNFYKENVNGKEVVYINMYNPTTYKLSNGNIIIAGNVIKGDENITVTNTASDVTIKLIKPSWTTPEITYNGNKISLGSDGYYTIDNMTGTTNVSVDYNYRLVSQRGHLASTDNGYSYTVFYGPLMLVANLNNLDGDKFVSYEHTYTQDTEGGEHKEQDNDYPDLTKQNLTYSGELLDNFECTQGDKLTFKFNDMDFIPYIDCIKQRFSIYMNYKKNNLL